MKILAVSNLQTILIQYHLFTTLQFYTSSSCIKCLLMHHLPVMLNNMTQSPSSAKIWRYNSAYIFFISPSKKLVESHMDWFTRAILIRFPNSTKKNNATIIFEVDAYKSSFGKTCIFRVHMAILIKYCKLKCKGYHCSLFQQELHS